MPEVLMRCADLCMAAFDRLSGVLTLMVLGTAALVAHAQSIGAPELAVPRRIIKIAEVPVLGTGKTDYVAIQRMADTDSRAA